MPISDQNHRDPSRDASHREEYRRAVEAIKLRAPIEDVVRERVPALKKRGALWVACCPFHDERTPSFTVDPRRGTWHCFGACGTGGDQISFLERFDNLNFKEVIEILAARTGIELPRSARAAHPGGDEAESKLLVALDHATRFYRAQLRTSEGQAAVRYLRERGLTESTADAFGVGYAPANGTAFVGEARSGSLDLTVCEKAGLTRRSDDGRAYDFFRGRLMIPIRDLKGRTLGFGARRLADDDASGPKYVNTSETELFHKGRLIYALDRAQPEARKQGRIVLVEGYTDVMAAHQCGLANVAAVLGTATTDDHAALLRRTGARKISLVFDGDEAGRKASYKALHGLLPLDVEIDVVSLPGGEDPCDLLVRDGAAGFTAQLEVAQGWLDFLIDGARGKRGVELSREVDRILELLTRLSKPVHRDACIGEIARALDLPAAGIHQQLAGLPGRRQAAVAPKTAPAPTPAAGVQSDREIVAACEQLVGAALLDTGLCPALRPLFEHCEDLDLCRIQGAMDELYCAEEDVTPSAVATILGEDPARERLWKLVPAPILQEDPREAALEIQDLFQTALRRLENRLLEREERALTTRMIELDAQVMSGMSATGSTGAVNTSLEKELERAREEFAQIRARKAQLGNQSTVRPQTARK